MAGATLGELATLVGGRLHRGRPDQHIGRVAPLEEAGPDALIFVTKAEYLERLTGSRAACCLISAELLARAPSLPAELSLLVVERPYVAFARIAGLLTPPAPRPAGRHPTAVVDATAQIAPDAALGPFVVIGAQALIGARAVLHAGVHVGEGAHVGEDAILYDHVVVRHGCRVGARAILHAGAVIGADGFGFAPEPSGDGPPTHVKIPQVGIVELEDDVEIGANACVDRATFGVTRVGRGTKIDNLVQVGHNVSIGEGSILVAQSGVAGSSKLGRAVTLGAQSGIAGHLEIGDGAIVLGQAGVMNDVAPREKVSGAPAIEAREFFRNVVRVSKLDVLMERVKRLERRVLGSAGSGER